MATKVPKKIIETAEVIYQTSGHLSVAEKIFPSQKLTDLKMKFEVVLGEPGVRDVALDASVNPTKLEYDEYEVDVKFHKFQFEITDRMIIEARENRMLKDYMKSGADYFAASFDYDVLSTALAGAENSAAASDTWDGENRDIEEDIVNAINNIEANSNVTSGETFHVVVPAKVFSGLNTLDLIHNVQQQMQEYMERAFNLKFYKYRPYKDASGNVVLDALSTNALVMTGGDLTLRTGKYVPPENVEQERLISRGYLYVIREGYASRVVPLWGSTNEKTVRIFKITGVSS